MAETSKIEWTDSTWNPWIGCTRISPACDHCYAAHSAPARIQGVHWGHGEQRRRTTERNWGQPLRWQRQSASFFAANGRRQRVFCASLADIFDNQVDVQWLVDVLAILMQTPDLDWLLLTKRIGIVVNRLRAAAAYAAGLPDSAELAAWIRAWVDGQPPANVWIGATVCNQDEATRDIPKLLAVPAATRFLSIEPLLGPISLRGLAGGQAGSLDWAAGLSWVIVGGESGPQARPMHPAWPQLLRDECAEAGIPFLFKQWGEWHTTAYNASTGRAVFRQLENYQHWINKSASWADGGICLDRFGNELRVDLDLAAASDPCAFPVTIMHRVGKSTAGLLLDGRLHDAYPEQAVQALPAPNLIR
ncbi:phage Gp37/Gp68 family protein [Stenotrophomonas maltophilia]|uniref:phage Gp37/Gp68 family protein n=1 Tax=Stenotrophomonas maltophilia TaxID=40324 RepID=UPI0039C2C920